MLLLDLERSRTVPSKARPNSKMDSSLVQEVQSYLNTIFLGRHSLFRDGCYASSFYCAPLSRATMRRHGAVFYRARHAWQRKWQECCSHSSSANLRKINSLSSSSIHVCEYTKSCKQSSLCRGGLAVCRRRATAMAASRIASQLPRGRQRILGWNLCSGADMSRCHEMAAINVAR